VVVVLPATVTVAPATGVESRLASTTPSTAPEPTAGAGLGPASEPDDAPPPQAARPVMNHANAAADSHRTNLVM
jgi:hypothetical protein